MTDWLVNLLSDAWWVYPLLAAVIVVDCVFPVLPSETALITTGIIAAEGGLSVLLLSLVGWVAAMAGDSLTYTIGGGPGGRIRERLMRKDKARKRMKQWQGQLDDRPWLIAAGRFIPGGRTAVALSAGSLGVPFLRFLGFVALGAAAWAPFNVLLGYLGGRLFQGSFWLSLGVSLLAAAIFAGIGELLHRRHIAG